MLPEVGVSKISLADDFRPVSTAFSFQGRGNEITTHACDDDSLIMMMTCSVVCIITKTGLLHPPRSYKKDGNTQGPQRVERGVCSCGRHHLSARLPAESQSFLSSKSRRGYVILLC